MLCLFFFFKQKTAYEMRISDWSSDVCSSDLIDTMGHINNVAISGIFETARIRFHHHLGRHPQEQGVRWLVANVNLNFVEEAHFPYPFEVHCAISHIGRTSWTISSAGFPKGVCVATEIGRGECRERGCPYVYI